MDSLLSRAAVGPWDQYYIKEPQKLPGVPIIDIPRKRIRETPNSKNYIWLRKHTNSEFTRDFVSWHLLLLQFHLWPLSLPLTVRWLDLCCFHFYEALATFLDLNHSQPPRRSSVILSCWKAFHEPSGCACFQSLRSPWKVLDGDKVPEDGGREEGTKCTSGQICPPTCSHFFALNGGGRMGKKIWEEFLIFLVLVSVLFLWASLAAQMGKNLHAMQETRVQSQPRGLNLRSLGEGNGYPLQHSCLENSMDRGAWQANIHKVAKSQAWLSN